MAHLRGGVEPTMTAVTAPISYGDDVPDDTSLKLCGEIGDGRRVVELGVSPAHNSIVVASAGGKAIAVDPEAARLEGLRQAAAAAEVHVECHQSDLADLGFLTSGSTELVVANHTLDGHDDPGRLLRQVHRVLRPGMPLVISLGHPFAEVDLDAGVGYGDRSLTIGDWLTLFERANFSIDRMLELDGPQQRGLPATMIVRTHKEGS